MTNLLTGGSSSASIPNLPSLTHREWEILLLLTEGIACDIAADRACVTRKSFHNYKNRICRKLGFRSCGDLTDFAIGKKGEIMAWSRLFHRVRAPN